MIKTTEETLGRTSGKRATTDKETWWWSEEVKREVRRKKELKKKWDTTGSQEDKETYKEAKKDTNHAEAVAKNRAWNELFDELETPEGEKKIFKLAKKREKASRDLPQIKQITDFFGAVLTEKDTISTCWKTYFENLLNEENSRSLFGDGIQNHRVTQEPTGLKVQRAVKKMKHGKATGPDKLPVKAWKCLGEIGIDQLTVL